MIKVLSQEFQLHPVASQIHQVIKRQHVISEPTAKELMDKKHIKDYCVITRHFAILYGSPDLWIHYDVSSWYKEVSGLPSAAIKIDSFVLYDNFIEYESSRVKELSAAKRQDRSGGLNLN